jgi:hypothetical protein
VKLARLLALSFVAAQFLGDGQAHAGIPVFEAYVGPRPKKVAALAPFLAELERVAANFLTSPRTIQEKFGVRLPLPGSDPRVTAAAFARTLDVADDTRVRQPPLEQLLPALRDAVEVAKSNPIFLVTDPSRRDVFRRVLLGYAIALKRSGNITGSGEAMAEWIRSFPDQVLTSTHDGSDAEQLYVDTRKALAKLGRGTLTVSLSDANLQLYVNEVIRRPGGTIADLVPGIYRVLVLDRYNKARRYTVEVLANQDPVLNIDWAIDAALNLTATYAAFEFATTDELAQAGPTISRFVQTAMGAPGVVVVHMAKTDRGQQVIASIYVVSRPKPMRSASVALSGIPGEDAERVASLARFIAHESSSPDVTIIARSEDAAPKVLKLAEPTSMRDVASRSELPLEAHPPPRSGHPYVIPGLLIGAGIAAFGWGNYVNYKESRDHHSDYTAAGLGLAAGGGVLMLIGGCLVIREATTVRSAPQAVMTSRRLPAIAFVAIRGGGALTLAGQF